MSTTVAKPSTLAIVDVALRTDDQVSGRIRDRVLGLLSRGSEETALASGEIGETAAGAILGLNPSTMSRWRRGLVPHRGPFPFTTRVDLSDRLRYQRAEVVAYLQQRLLASAAQAGGNTP